MIATTPPTVLLFDIDGTLVAIGGSGRRAMERAFEEICGSSRACPKISFGGLTDRVIVAEGFKSVEMEASEAKIQSFFAVYHEFLREELQRPPPIDALPGAHSLLRLLKEAGSVALGLGTGNTREGAYAKLGAVGLENFFSFGGFGCDHANRTKLIRIGSERGAQTLGIRAADARVVVIGDTPRDIFAAKEAGAESIAIATGEFTVDALTDFAPTAVFSSLESPRLPTTLLNPKPSR